MDSEDEGDRLRAEFTKLAIELEKAQELVEGLHRLCNEAWDRIPFIPGGELPPETPPRSKLH